MRKTASSSGLSTYKLVLILTILSAYPVFVHVAHASDRSALVGGLWLLIAALGSVVALIRRSVLPALLFAGLLAAGIGLWWWGDTAALMYLPPVLINVLLMIVFWRTLRPGSMPLVGRVAALWRGELDPEVADYCRRVTIAWIVFFAAIAIESAALAFFAPVLVWSLFTNFLNYIAVVLFFVVEYRIRLRRLAGHEHLSFRDFCRLLVSTDLGTLAR